MASQALGPGGRVTGPGGPGGSPGADPAFGARRRRAIIRVLLWVLIPNLAVAAAKLAYGILTGTLSVTSDGLHSLLDGSGNIVGIVAVTAAARPADPGHPYGHRKFETLAALVVAVLLVLAAFTILSEAWRRLTGAASVPEFSWVGVAIILVTMAVNFTVSRLERAAGRRLSSEFLIADAMHTASDLYASTSVLVAMIALGLGVPIIDPIASVAIVGLLGRVAWQILSRSAEALADAAVVDPGVIENLATGVPGVESAHSVRSRGAPGHAFVDLHIEVDPGMTTDKAHDVAHDVEEILIHDLGVADVMVHIEPVGRCAARTRSPE